MIINQEALARLYTGFTAVFNAAFQDTQTWHDRVAMTVPANTRIMDYKFLLDFPMVREWIGDRQISSLEPKAYQVESKDWEATIEVDRNDIEDDQLGLVQPHHLGPGPGSPEAPGEADRRPAGRRFHHHLL